MMATAHVPHVAHILYGTCRGFVLSQSVQPQAALLTLLCPCRLRLKHPLDMRMPLLFDDGPSSSTPSHNSTSRDSRSSVFGEIAAPTSQGVPAETWRSSEAGSHDRALWGSEALMEAPDMQNAQRLVGESICSLQVGQRAYIEHAMKAALLGPASAACRCWPACITCAAKVQAACSPGLLNALESSPQHIWCLALE